MNIKRIILFLLIINFNTINSQEFKPFKSGEWLKYKISYGGWLKAGEATMTLTNDTLDNRQFYHVVAIGKTVGPINWFFKVNDRYESYFDKKDTGLNPCVIRTELSLFSGGTRETHPKSVFKRHQKMLTFYAV